MSTASLPKLPKDLKDIPKDKQEILILGFSLSVHVLRGLYLEVIDKLKFIDMAPHDCVGKFKMRLDTILPIVEPGGFRIHLNNKNYSMMYKKIPDIKQYNLDTEINKIPNLGRLSDLDKQNFIKEIDICASSVSSVNTQLMKRKDFQKLIKDIFDIFDDTLPQNEADKCKDIGLKIIDNQRVYHIYEDGIYFGIFIDTLNE